ncbi:MAG: hypothetical protein JHC89_03575 [Acetobacteraceae bacterium]|nr:hypothetical protein [Acetobacteraceae bacterium]
MPIAEPSRFVAPASGNAPEVGSDFSLREGNANRAKRIARNARYLHHHESCQQNPSHLAKKMRASHHDARSVTCMPQFYALQRAFSISEKMMKASGN